VAKAYRRRLVLRAMGAIAIAALLIRRLVPRPAFLPLATRVDGPPPADAAAVIVFLHGKSGGLETGERMVRALREVGLPGNVAIVLVEGPYHTWFGHCAWRGGRRLPGRGVALARARPRRSA
jgi:hypothetical protein